MSRIILLAGLFLVLYFLLKRIATNFQGKTWGSNTKTTDQLIECSQCGMHVLQAESRLIHGKYYCNNPACDPEAPQN